MSTDYYKTLGVSKTATKEEIKSAFRKLAKEYHPDVTGNDKDKAEKFKEIGEAYAVLSDDEKRKQYDMFGSNSSGFSGSQGGFSGGFGGGFGGFDFGDIFKSAGFGDLGDIFGAASKPRGGTKRPGEDLKYRLDITLEDSFYGKEKEVSFKSFVQCGVCDGSGSKDKKEKTCQSCKGTGAVRYQQGFFLMEQPCQECGGSGKVPSNPCSNCSGEGRVLAEKKVVFDLPAGVPAGTNIKLTGKGAAGRNKGPSGDLYVEVSIKKHDIFERSGNDLTCSVPVSFALLTLGGKISVNAIDGEKIEVAIPAGTQTGHVFNVKSKGMPVMKSGGRRGDLKIKVDVIVPTSLTPKQEERVRAMEEIMTEKNHPFNTKKSFFDKIKTIINS